MRKKSVYRRTKPPEHLVSAVFDELFTSGDLTVLRWWYGEIFQEQRMSRAIDAPPYIERIKLDDLRTMEVHVWGTTVEKPLEMMSWPPPPQIAG